MTQKGDYSNIPTAEPYVEGFAVGSTHAVTVIVDDASSSIPHSQAGAHRGRSQQHPPTHPPTTATHFYYDDNEYDPLQGSRTPVNLAVCPMCCKENVRTRTRTYPSFVTWVGVVFSACVFFPLFWVPLVVDPMKQTDHFCQSCGRKIGTVKPLQGCCIKEEV